MEITHHLGLMAKHFKLGYLMRGTKIAGATEKISNYGEEFQMLNKNFICYSSFIIISSKGLFPLVFGRIFEKKNPLDYLKEGIVNNHISTTFFNIQHSGFFRCPGYYRLQRPFLVCSLVPTSLGSESWQY